MNYSKSYVALICITLLFCLVRTTGAVPVTLQNGTATNSQPAYSPSEAIDGDITSSNNGWALDNGGISSQTAVWETVTDVDATQLDIQLNHNQTGQLLTGRFRFSVTTDDRSTFADGLDVGGDVTANWTVLSGLVVTGPAGMTFTPQGDNSILVGGTVLDTGVYDIQYTGSLSGVTGIRLEVIEDPSLPSNGPGFAGNGNLVLTEIVVTAVTPLFVNVAVSAGVDESEISRSVSWVDYDGDEDLDIYIGKSQLGTDALYRNNGNNTFTNVAASAGIANNSNAFNHSWADYDNDGDLDVYIGINSSNSTVDRFYRNNGDGTFSEIASIAGVADGGNARGVGWADYNADGYADVYVATSTTNRLFHNNGDGTFTDKGAIAGVNSSLDTRGASWGDFNSDAQVDLYLTNKTTNQLYKNNGNGTFTEIGVSAGVADTDNGRGASWGDFDHDGDLDLYVGKAVANKLYRNEGNETFSEIGAAAGVADINDSYDGLWGDYDNDADLDLFLVNTAGGNRIYRNEGNETFSEVNSETGISSYNNDNASAAWGDYDQDGDLDIYTVATTTPNELYQNSGNGNNWLSADLVGTISNPTGIGARLIAVTGGIRQRRDVETGVGWLSQASLSLEFGFGATSTIDSLIAVWPSGQVWDTTNVASNQFLTIYEPLPQIVIPDTIAAYADTINVPVRLESATNQGIVAVELKIAYDNTIVTPGSPDKTDIVGTLVALGWSVEENVLPGSGTTDTLTVAMSTASDTINIEGTLISLVFYTADIRHPASTPLELIHVLLNDGTPSSSNQDGSLALTGTNGSIVALPDSINPADVVTVTVTDTDFDVDVGTAEQVSATAVSKVYGDTETVLLTETGVNTGIFTGTLNTSFSLVADPSQNGTLGTVAGDSICVSFLDSLDTAGASVTRVDTVEVIGGVDGIVVVSYVVQAFDGRNGVRDTVRIEVADADLDTDVGVAEQVSATITNAISGEVEGVNLIETGVNTGVFQIRVPTIAGASGTNNDSELSLASWDTLNVAYNDALSSQGGLNVVSDITRVVNVFGDVQPNDQIQAFDAARLLAISVGLISSNTQTTLVGDVDGGGSITAFDASLALQYVVRLIDRFPVQTDFTADPKNHPFEKPVLSNVIALGTMVSQDDGTYLVPVQLAEREGVLSGTLTFGVDAGVEVVDIDLTNAYGSFMIAHNTTDDGVKVAFAGSQSELSGSGDVLMLRVRGVEGVPIRLSLDQVSLNGQSLTPSVNIEVLEAVESPITEFVTELHQNLPNPFNPQTTIRYGLADAGQVSVVIYSVTGQRVRTLVRAFQESGAYQVTWDGQDALGHQVSSGVYLMRMQTGGFIQTRKMLLLR